MIRARVVAALIVLAAVVACAREKTPLESGDGSAELTDGLRAALRLARTDASLAGLVSARRDPKGSAPTRASGALAFSAGSGSTIGVTLVGAGGSEASIRERAAVYSDALEDADRVVIANENTTEDFVLLRSARSPRTLSWHFDVPAAITRVTEDAGALTFVNAQGEAALSVPRPFAIDAQGTKRALEVTWNAVTAELAVSLGGARESWSYPVLVDPRFEAWTWRPKPILDVLCGSGGAYDPVRNQTILFGGYNGSAPLGDTWLFEGTSWRRATPSVSPPSRESSAMVFDVARGVAVMFGGYKNGDFLGDTWIWDGKAWKNVTPTEGASPSPRYGTAMAYDRERQRAVLFGGSYESSPTAAVTYYDDTWEWDGAAWTRVSLGAGARPGARAGANVAYNPARRRVVMMGGWYRINGGASELADDEWAFDGTAWADVTRTPRPPARSQALIAFDEARGELVVFGGDGVDEIPRSDMWVERASGWVERTPTTRPSQRSYTPLTYDPVRQKLTLFGGYDGNYMKDTWEWDGATWTSVPAAVFPAPGQARLVYDKSRAETFYFGVDGTWIWNGIGWRKPAPAHAPSARESFAVAYDDARNQVVLHGGVGAGLFTDTWTWDGTDWTERPTAAQPSVRRDASFAYDPSSREVILYGGRYNENTYDETWSWNGATWRKLLPGNAPRARAWATFTYDAKHDELILFGGNYFGPTNDTWSWKNGLWTEKKPAIAPPERYNHTAAYDEAHQVLVVYGGSEANSFRDDVWLWDGTNWAPLSFTAGPGPRADHGLSFDPGARELVMFGGVNGTSLGDTWTLLRLSDPCTQDTDCKGAYCVDKVCCNVQQCGTCETCDGLTPGRCSPVTNREDADTCAEAAGSSCSEDADCKKALGIVAATASECASGIAVDGVCCNNACAGRCQACRADLKESGTLSGICDTAKSSDTEACNPAACDGDHTVINSNGSTVDCGLFKCEGSVCKKSCTSIADCVFPAQCTSDGRCIAFSDPPPTDDGGCSCHVGGGAPFSRARDGASVGLACVALLLLRRKRSR